MPCSFWNFKVVRASQTKPMEFLSVSSHCVCDLAGYYVHMLLAALPCGKHVIIEDVFTNSVGVGGHFCSGLQALGLAAGTILPASIECVYLQRCYYPQ